MKHTPLTILSVLALALVGCGSTQAQEEPESTEAVTAATPTAAPEATEEPTEATTEPVADDYTDYLAADQRNTATDEQLNAYNICMAENDQFMQDLGEEFNGMDAHYNCEPFITDTSQPEIPDLTEADWENIKAINECADDVIANDPQVRADLPQEAILEDPTIVYQHPEVIKHCM